MRTAPEQTMQTDSVRRILDDAERARDELDRNANAEKAGRRTERLESGNELRRRLLPRLESARREWTPRLEVRIEDESQKVSSTAGEVNPFINFKVSRGSRDINLKFEALQSGKLTITTKHSKVDLAPELNISGVQSLDDEKSISF